MADTDFTGQTFGRWCVLREAPRRGEKRYLVCVCRCGAIRSVQLGCLKNGSSKSCGCLSRELSAKRELKHGAFGLAEFNSWAGMISRCTNKDSPSYSDYGGRGITVSSRWAESFWAFLEDVGRRPSMQHTLGRIDNDGGYEPGNVRWETSYQQARNKRVGRNNTTGYAGVYFKKSRAVWVASLKREGRRILYKEFKTMAEAISARRSALEQYDQRCLANSARAES